MQECVYKAVVTFSLLLGPASTFGQRQFNADWMLAYVHKADQPWQQKDVRNDPRYKTLLREGLGSRRSIWGPSKSLVKMAETYLDVGTGVVDVQADRYLSISGCVPHNCTDADGLLWLDSKAVKPKLYFAATEQIADYRSPKLHLWIFPPSNTSKSFRQTSDEDRTKGLPQPFLDALRSWFNEVKDRKLMSLTIVNPNGELVAVPACELHIALSCAE